MSNYFEEDCKRYIEECESNGITFQDDFRRSLIQGAKSSDAMFDPNKYAAIRLRALNMLLKEAKKRGWLNELLPKSTIVGTPFSMTLNKTKPE